MELEAEKDDFGEMGGSENELRNNFYCSLTIQDGINRRIVKDWCRNLYGLKKNWSHFL